MCTVQNLFKDRHVFRRMVRNLNNPTTIHVNNGVNKKFDNNHWISYSQKFEYSEDEKSFLIFISFDTIGETNDEIQKMSNKKNYSGCQAGCHICYNCRFNYLKPQISCVNWSRVCFPLRCKFFSWISVRLWRHTIRLCTQLW